MAAPDYSGITSDIQGGYNNQRMKAQQQEGANLQGQRDALNRRAAQLGGGPSGALINADQQAQNQSAQRLQSADADINAAQNQELRGVKMTQLGQQFTSGEREAGQQFQSGLQANEFNQQKNMAEEARQQQTKMQAAEFNQQSNLAEEGRQQQTKMQEGNQAWQGTQNELARRMQQGNFDTQMGFEREKFHEQSGVDAFNERIAQQMADKKDPLEKLFTNMNPFKNGFGTPHYGGAGGGLAF